MHNDDFGSRVKPWRGVTVVARADRPPVIGADYVVDQNPEVDGHSNRIFVPYWPQPGVQPRERTDNTIQTVAYFGRVDSFPAEYQSDEFKQRLAEQGIALRISFNNWTDYRDVDICVSFRKSHDHKLVRKPASKLINNWLGKTVMICDDEQSFRAIRESELDYLIAKNPDEAFAAIMKLKNDPELYQKMREQGEKRLQVYSREAVAARWMALFERYLAQGFECTFNAGPHPPLWFWQSDSSFDQKVLSYDDDFTPQSYTYITADGRFCRAVRAARNHYPVKGPRL